MIEITLDRYWNKFLSSFPEDHVDIYFREEYVRLYENTSERSNCLVVRDGDNIMIFPFLQREFKYNGKSYLDFETAYGYGGPIFNKDNEEFKIKSIEKSIHYLAQKGYICGFVRFHTLIDNYKYFNPSLIVSDRQTVSIDLRPSVDEIWKNQIHSKNRNVIKKGEKTGLKFVVDDEFEHIDEFVCLYNATMSRLAADNFYFFDEQYYQAFKRDIKNSFLGLVYLDNKPISAAIFMYDGKYAHYHLSGSNREYLYCSPNNYLLFHAAIELKNRGAETFHLGGGTTSKDDDSLFAFKSKFSPYRHQFNLGKIIFDLDTYCAICHDWELNNPEKVEKYKHYLLKYKY